MGSNRKLEAVGVSIFFYIETGKEANSFKTVSYFLEII